MADNRPCIGKAFITGVGMLSADMVGVGDDAPEFTLRGVTADGSIEQYTLESLTDDAALLLGVYPYDFSPVCTRQLCDIDDFEWMTFEDRLNVVAVGGDGPYSHQRFSEERNISYPLLCDTAKDVCESFGVLDEEKDGVRKVPRRSVFLVGPDGRVEYRWVAEDNWTDWEQTPLQDVKDRFDELDL